jgi:hypothetical protein
MGLVDYAVGSFPHMIPNGTNSISCCSIYNGIFFVGMLLFYFPDSHLLRKGTVSRRELAKRIDYTGGVLSITGVLLL